MTCVVGELCITRIWVTREPYFIRIGVMGDTNALYRDMQSIPFFQR